MKIGSLFSGIGGLELGLERSGLGTVAWQCEIDPFCRSVLARHWPDARRYEDVRTVDATAPSVDVICGGFPCQDVSLAGKRAGLAGERSGLWHEFARIIGELEPKIVVIENVLGLRTSGLPRVLADLAALGFDAEWADLAASDIGAPHQRRRMFIVATHTDRIDVRSEPGWLERACREVAAVTIDDGEDEHAAHANIDSRESWRTDHACKGEGRRDSYRGVVCSPVSDADGEGEPQQEGALGAQWRRSSDGCWRPPVSPIRRMDDGISNRSHGRRLKALGNAVVPACAEVIGRAIVEAIG